MSDESREIVLVRHGETEWSKSGRHTGRSDIPLTEHGRQQADHVTAALAGRDFSTILSSPLQRARETCERAGLAGRAQLDRNLLEWDYGAYEGRTTAEIRREIPNWSTWTHPTLDGESAQQVGVRADVVIDRLLAASGDAVLFAHGHFLRILTARWLGLAATDGRLFALRTATISVLGFEHSRQVIQRWNDDSHLREARAS